MFADGFNRARQQRRESCIAEALALQLPQLAPVEAGDVTPGDGVLAPDDGFDLPKEPGVDAGGGEHLVERHAMTKALGHVPEPPFARLPEFALENRLDVVVGGAFGQHFIQTVHADLEPAECLLEGLAEGTPDGHDLTHRLHLRGQPVVGIGKLLEGEAWNLRDHVVNAGLEGGGRPPTRDLVVEFVERITDGELGRDARDREARRLRGECRGTRHARVHLDDDHLAVRGVDRELHVGAAGVDTDLAQHRGRGVAHDLVFLVGQRLRGCDGDRIAGVNAHRVEVLDRADDDDVVGPVTHHFHLVLLPAEHRLFEEHFRSARKVEPALHDGVEVFGVVGDAATAATHREGRADDAGETDVLLPFPGFGHGMRNRCPRCGEADPRHCLTEALAILRLVDGIGRGADHFHAEGVEHAFAVEVERAVECRLPAHGGQNGIGALALDDAPEHAPVDRLDVGDVGHGRVGHDRGRIRVHENDAVAVLAQCLAGLGARVVELAGLADDDRAGADDQDAFDVVTLRHQTRASAPARASESCFIMSMNSSKRASTSCGPGLASGCP